MQLDNDVPCANCGRIDGAPTTTGYEMHEDGYLPGGWVIVPACSHCAEALQATLDSLYSRRLPNPFGGPL